MVAGETLTAFFRDDGSADAQVGAILLAEGITHLRLVWSKIKNL